ncbi:MULTISPECIES: DUF4198 domain-containing protein [Pseudoalteromonas]|uniref:DUF4198 domain-containing protein n=1 Tax=Pseudoalteromonas fuliginea TaxID=1872678 RepID=A0ABD3YCS7_9GAMM|nr:MULTISPECIES: DUF4198 domain-containing protein [Pseudoalteromonas]KDC51477.1 hypothetical protein DO88_16035 [Pseudoalteromonas sp. S3431]KDC52481.1 hypothetical protein DC53_04455 [Pseudoalteromonas fuliginea]KJZ28234.1 hypothetical protein TW82_08180 [Pseudoalteromonas fuliginea]
MRLKKLLTGVMLLTVCATSYAHTPYLAPYSFDESSQDNVTLDAAFAEKFFVPELAFNNSIFTVITPNGETINPDNVVKLHLRMVVEHQLKEEGTYRFSTGKRLGRVFKMYEINGERKSLENPMDAIPEGGKLLAFFQSLTLAESYVTKGAPSETALKPYGQGLEFVAKSHPNELFVGERLSMVSVFNGKPLADLTVDVFQANDQFSNDKPSISLKSNDKGEFSFMPQKQGVYLLRARYKSDAPKGSPAPQISNTYTLVVEATE